MRRGVGSVIVGVGIFASSRAALAAGLFLAPSLVQPAGLPMVPGSGGPMAPASSTASTPPPTCTGTGLLFNVACNSQYLGVTGL